MNFNQEKSGFSQQLPRIIVVALMHVLVLGLIINSMKVRTTTPSEEKFWVDTLPETPKPREPETPPPIPKAPDFKEPTMPKFPIPEVPIDPPPAGPTITGEFDDKPVSAPHPNPGSKSGASTDIASVVQSKPQPPAKPVQIAAIVDASACAKPEYPRNAARNGESGTVMLALLVGLDGRVIDAKVTQSSGYRELDKAAVQGLSLCKFIPGTIDGVPQQSWAKLEYKWALTD